VEKSVKNIPFQEQSMWIRREFYLPGIKMQKRNAEERQIPHHRITAAIVFR